ncbi:hypothetical protein DICPUDRAFT_38648 [Dictyostelium purpureum]|uniref:Uncharacterized protein n=1 Tax=Dictyostelium purpureum TaxID=5786 RepID=F0ZUW0_DICPU|nr:uncharacterized protein DICPUDRAFT_38648 [Dictyostelium purpureum]EGC32273.1 hypothetical protein DICPUDRAFT_38648 [Dictyostelium purpureum]|eukprot:XP_003291210.1 hypothetical protein DICPUDRAFT_38648 [Dictyostelium purpureum]
MDRVFFLVFRNNYLRKLIFEYVNLINSKKYSKNRVFKYHQIKTLDWLCVNEKWMLLKDMITTKHPLKITENSLITICKSVKDVKLFEHIYNGLRKEFQHYDFMFIDYACAAGSLDVVKFLHEQKHSATFKALDNASWKGFKNIIEFLLDNRTEGASKDAIDEASANGYIDIVELLTERTTAGCSKTAMNLACKNGHFEMVQYLHKNRTEGCSTKALDYCCQYGHLDIYKYLYENNIIAINNFNTLRNHIQSDDPKKNYTNRYITDEGLRFAVRNGHFNIVKYILDNQLFNQSEVNTIFKDSLYQKNLEIVKLLEKYSSEPFSKDHFLEFLNRAISNELINNINYLFDEFNHKLTIKEFKRLVFDSVRYSNFEIFKNIYNRAVKAFPTLNNFSLSSLTLTRSLSSSPPSSSPSTLHYDKNQLNEKKLFMFSIKRLDLEKTRFIYEKYQLQSFDINNIALSYCIYNLNLPLTKFLVENIFTSFNPENYLLSPVIKLSTPMYTYLNNYKNENMEKLQKLKQQQSYQFSQQYQASKVIFIVNNEDFKTLSLKYFDEFHVMNEKLYRAVLENVSSKLIMYSKRRHHICNK